jgi:23S rRNA (uracil1939-C5)-methyltransferase
VGKNKDGEIITGFYAGRTHSIISNKNCYLGTEVNEQILEEVLVYMKENHIEPYDEVSGTGLVRHVLIRCGFKTGEIMVCLVLNGDALPKAEKLTARLQEIPGMTSITFNVNKKRNNVILGDKIVKLWGQDYISDYIGEVQYRISPLSFYQVNPVQTEKLYNTALEYAGLTGKEIVWDLYCGIGTISLFLAQKAKQVYGVEIVPAAIADAKKNAQRNGIANAEFYVGKAEDVLPKKYEEEGVSADVIVVDPPRKGCDEALLETMLKMNPERIVYVSCDSATLARDLKRLCAEKYEVKRVAVCDMFPQGVHVETVVMLSHKKPDSVINVKVEFGEGEGKVPLDNIAKRAEVYKPKERVTYKMIKEYIEAKYGFKVHTAYIAEVKRALGLPMYDAPNAVEELKQPRKHPTAEKVEAIKDALKHFEVI